MAVIDFRPDVNGNRVTTGSVQTEDTKWYIDDVLYNNIARLDVEDITTEADKLANCSRLRWTIQLQTLTGYKWMYLHGIKAYIGDPAYVHDPAQNQNDYLLYEDASGNILGEWTKYNGVWVTERPFVSGEVTFAHKADGTAPTLIAYIKVLFRYGKWAWDNSVYYRENKDYGTNYVYLNKIDRDFTSTPIITNIKKESSFLDFRWSTSEPCNKIEMKTNDKIQTFTINNQISGDIRVDNLTPDTDYVCQGTFYRADSGRPLSSNDLKIKTMAIPQQRFISKTETSITMGCSAGRDTISKIQYSINNGANWSSPAISLTNGQYTISNLNPYTVYNIKTRIIRTDGTVADTTAMQIRTYAYPRHSKRATGERDIKVNWSCDGDILKVGYKLNNGGFTPAKDLGGYYTIENLQPGTNYKVRTVVVHNDGTEKQSESQYYLDYTTHRIPSFSLSKGNDEHSLLVNWEGGNTAIKEIKYSINQGKNWSPYQDAGSKTSSSFIIEGLQPNTSYTVWLQMKRTDDSESSIITAPPATTYALPSFKSGSNFIIGDDYTLIFTNPLKKTIDVTVYTNNGEAIGTWIGSEESATIKSTQTQIQKMYESIPNSKSGYYKVGIKDQGDAVDSGCTYTIRGDVSDSPIFSSYSYRDIMNNEYGTDLGKRIHSLVTSAQTIIKGFSSLEVSIGTDQKARVPDGKCTTIDSYSLISATTQTIAESIGNVITFAPIHNINNNSWSVQATDKRGLSTTVSSIVSNYLDYYKPVIYGISTSRTDNNIGINVQLKVNGIFWNGNFGKVNNKDRLEAYYSYKKNEPGATWSKAASVNITSEGNTYNINEILGDSFELGSTYDFIVYIADALCDNTSTTSDILSASFAKSEVTNGTPALAIWGDKVSIGDAWDTRDTINRLRVNGSAYISGNLEASTIKMNGDFYWSGTYTNFHLVANQDVSEWSFDLGSDATGGRSSFSNCFFQFWSRKHELPIMQLYNDDCSVIIPNGSLTVQGTLINPCAVANASATWVPVIQNGRFEHTERRFATSVTHTNYGTNGGYLATMDFLSYWNGAHNSSGNSNLAYCNRGAFGTIVTKNSGDYLATTGGSVSGQITGTSGNGLIIRSNSNGSWKEGIRVYPASNNFSLLYLGNENCTSLFSMVHNATDNRHYFDVAENGVCVAIQMPFKAGTIALTNDVPTVFIQSAQPTALRKGDIWFKA